MADSLLVLRQHTCNLFLWPMQSCNRMKRRLQWAHNAVPSNIALGAMLRQPCSFTSVYYLLVMLPTDLVALLCVAVSFRCAGRCWLCD
jgi:hypothetical protein